MFAGFHPIIFSAVLDTPAISQHRFLLVLEGEHLLPYSLSTSTTVASVGNGSSGTGGRVFNTHTITNFAPRFSVGSINGTRDPRTPVGSSSVNPGRAIGRNSNEKPFVHMVGGMSLIELSITNARNVLTIPKGWHLAHPFIYVVDCSTDENGWQYCHHIRNGSRGIKGLSGENNDVSTDSIQIHWLHQPILTAGPSASSSLDSKTQNMPGHPSIVGTSSVMRRRLWMATIVPAEHLALSKRLLYENLKLSFFCRSDQTPILQGDLLRYEKGTLTKSWQLRSVRLYSNRLEFYSGNSKKGEVLLTDCEVKMLFRNQLPCPCPSLSSMYGTADQDNTSDPNYLHPGYSAEGGFHAFSIRNPLGSVSILVDAGSHEARVRWVLAIQLALHSHDLNFMPFEYGPPMPVSTLASVLNIKRSTLPYYPHHRVLLYGTAVVQVLNAGVSYGGSGRGVDLWSFPQTLQLLPTELILIDNRSDQVSGRLPLDKMAIAADEKGLSFTIKTAATGISLVIDTAAGSDSSSTEDGSRIHVRQPNFTRTQDEDLKTIPQSSNSIWLLAIRRQISFIDNQKLKMKTSPKEEQLPQTSISFRDRLQLYYADSDIANRSQLSADETTFRWTAPSVDGLSDEYLHHIHFPHKPIPLAYSSPASGDPNHCSTSPEDDGLEQSLEFVNEKLLLGIGETESRVGTGWSKATKASPSLSVSTLASTFSANRVNADEEESVLTVATKMTDDQDQFKISTRDLDSRPHEDVKSNSEAILATESIVTSAVPHSSTTFHISGGNSVSSGSSGSGGQVSVPGLPSQPSRRCQSSASSSATSSAKRSLINPKFILTVLKGITHRFVLVLECERKRTAVDLSCPPRFTVGGPKACKDPRTAPLEQLLEISNRRPEIQLPSGWLMLHQYIYIIQPNTDEHGWQYRSSWSDGAITSRDEQWIESAQENANLQVRRRLWMTTVVRKDEFLRAKKAVMDNLMGSRGEIIMQGVLFKYQPDTTAASSGSVVGSSADNSSMSSSINWQKRKVLLFHNKLELYIGNDKKGEASLLDCEVKMLFNNECPGRKFAFSVRNPSGSVSVVFDAESRESRLRWVAALQYQLAVIYPDINFPPFEYGPPTGSHPDDRVLLCGDLFKGGGGGGGSSKWVKMHFQLRPYELLYYEISAPGSTTLKGRLRLEHAVIRTPREKEKDSRSREIRDDGDNEFQLRSASGMTLMLKAEKESEKLAWIRALKRHVQYIENEKLRRSTTPPEELPDEQGRRGNLTEAQRIAQYFDNDAWCASEASLDSDGLSVGNISNRTLQSIEEDLAFLQSRKKQMNSHSEIWDSNSLEFDGVGGDAEQQQRIYNRRPAQPQTKNAASPSKSIQKSTSTSRPAVTTSVSFALADSGVEKVTESVDQQRGSLTLLTRTTKAQDAEEEEDIDWDSSPPSSGR